MSSEPLVSCEGLAKHYETRSGLVEALHRLDAAFERNRVTAVVGVSGSGKSTLLRLIAGLEGPSHGALLVAGRRLDLADAATLRRHRRETVAYVAQKPADNFISHLTLRDHLPPGDHPPIFEELGVAHRLDARPAELSGGEQARAAFALALLRGAPLVVSDEPTAELDRETAGLMLAAIRRHAEAGVTFILATHDADVIEASHRELRLEGARPAPAAEDRDALADEQTRVVLSARELAKSYGGVPAVRRVSIELRSRELSVLVGRSGSGKSTLLMLLAGWQRPDGGSLEHHSGAEPSALGWGTLAFVPQRFGLLPELTVRENIVQPARLDGSLARRGAAVDSLLASLGLSELADRFPGETSIGQQQRAALARALVLEPEILIADEPTSHQDPGSRETVWRALRAAAERGTSCLVATHEENAAAYGTRVAHLQEGELVEAAVTPAR